MNRHCLAILGAGLALWAAEGEAQNARRGGEAYKLCASCHGFEGEGSALVGAPSLAGQEDWYLERQIQNFRRGVRGGSVDDAAGHKMAQMTAGILADGDVADLVAYIGTLPVAHSPATIDGDAAKGETQYATCAACHGQEAEGNAALNAPALAGVDDWYQVVQLEKFRNGQRGAHRDDTYGQQMAPMSKVLADESAMRDVVAYINSLQ